VPHRTKQGSRRLRGGNARKRRTTLGRSPGVFGIGIRMLFRGTATALAASAAFAGAGGVATASAERPTGVPAYSLAPAITGTAAEHKKLKVLKGAWSGGTPLHYTYAWSRCSSTGTECQAISGASKAAYQAVAGDVGHRLVATVTASNLEGSTEASTAPSDIVAAGAPKHKGRPTISGEVLDGRLLTAGDGVWKGTAPFTYTYQWERCAHGPCTPISGATEKTYRARTADITHKLRVIVVATNSAGSGKVLSKPTLTVVPGSPVNLVGPTISGIVLPGQTLTANDGTWVGTPPITFNYQWLSCAPLGGGCSEIAGATEPTYTIGIAEIGDSFEVVVTATNAQGQASATSPETSITGGGVQPPVDVLPPSIVGLAITGQTLTATEGIWTGTEPTFTHQWELCNSSGGACTEIEGATSSTFTIPDGDAGHTLRVTVTASNAAGTASATSEHSLEILGVAPVDTEAPSISGTATAGQTLTASSGKWSGTEPILFEYEWLRCNAAGGECSQAAAASLLGITYTVVPADVGHTLRVKVLAKNVAGSGSAESPATAEVGGVLPDNLIAPLVVGLTITGQTVSATEGTWAGTEPITYKFQWELCNASGAACSLISGATSSTLTIPDGDAGHTLKVLVLAKNVAGSVEAISTASTEILGVGPKNTEAPKVTGTATAGQTLTTSSGKWSGTEPILFEYEWLRCNKAGTECTTAAAASLIGASYTVVPADVGHALKVRVIAKNVAGSASAESAATAEVNGVLPSNVIAPLIVAAPVSGIAATATEGTWTGTEPISYTFQWIHCNNKGEACSEISGATKNQYTPTVGEIGKELKVKVTAKNVAGSVAKESAATIPIVL
jgi:large repetitive protein